MVYSGLPQFLGKVVLFCSQLMIFSSPSLLLWFHLMCIRFFLNFLYVFDFSIQIFRITEFLSSVWVSFDDALLYTFGVICFLIHGNVRIGLLVMDIGLSLFWNRFVNLCSIMLKFLPAHHYINTKNLEWKFFWNFKNSPFYDNFSRKFCRKLIKIDKIGGFLCCFVFNFLCPNLLKYSSVFSYENIWTSLSANWISVHLP